MEHNGDLYACDHYVEPDYLLGNIMETPMIDLVASEQQRPFGRPSWTRCPGSASSARCASSATAAAPRTASWSPATATPNLNYLCEGYKSFFRHIDQPMRMMAEELRNRRAPANVMRVINERDLALEKAFAAAGRNDPCPCGSGRKFKQCHGRSRA